MKRTIAVIFGGQSAEHDVSIITAHLPIIQSLLASGQYDVWPVYVAKDGSWYADLAMNDLAYFQRHDVVERLAKLPKLRLLFDHGLVLLWPGLRAKSVRVDVVFPAMHGTYGEDGSLMGLLRMANVPFVGCDLFASAVAMDKVLTKQVLAAEGLPVVPYAWCTKSEWTVDRHGWDEALGKLAWPRFVKPVHLGSSIGLTKVKDAAEQERAVEVAFHYDDKVLVEESVEDLIEVTLPIIGNDELQFAGLERPLNRTEFFNFDDKYLSGRKKQAGVNSQYSEIPAKIGDELTAEVRRLGAAVYRTLGCSGIARVDFLIHHATHRVFVNEVNTLPGSLYHHNWKTVGVSGVELVTRLVAFADERFQQRRGLTFAFNSDVLRHVGGRKVSG